MPVDVDYWQSSYATKLEKGYAGMLVGLGHPEVDSYANSADDAAQVSAIAIGTPVADTDYSLTFDGVTATIRSGATTTATEIRDALIAAINQSSIYNKAVAVATGPGTFEFVARKQYAGIDFTVSVAGGGAGFEIDDAASTAASVSGGIGYGLVVVRGVGDPDGVARLPNLAGQRVLGITIGDLTSEQRDGKSEYRRGKMVSVWRSGPPDIMVYIESDVTMDDTPYYRHTPNAALDIRGAIRAGSNLGCSPLTGYRFKSSGKAGTYAILGKE